MKNKIMLILALLICLVIVTNTQAGYDEYSKVYLGWQKLLKTVATYTITEAGWYRVVFQAQVVNDSKACGDDVTVMITAKLHINGIKIKGWTENVDSKRHYGNPTLVKDVWLEAGDVVDIRMRADSNQQYPYHSVFVLTDEDRFQFDVQLTNNSSRWSPAPH